MEGRRQEGMGGKEGKERWLHNTPVYRSAMDGCERGDHNCVKGEGSL